MLPTIRYAARFAKVQHHEENFPVISNSVWGDCRLHTKENYLTHLVGRYHPALAVTFTSVRSAVSDSSDIISDFFDPIGIAPADIRPSLKKFFEDHPAYHRNCFLVMSFNPSPFYLQITQAIRRALQQHGYNCLRADDREYSEQLMQNIRTYIYGSAFGIAVFERIMHENYNPNVALEIGYFLGLNRPICLLKERTLPRLPADLIGHLYREFDIQNVDDSIATQIERWLQDRRLI